MKKVNNNRKKVLKNTEKKNSVVKNFDVRFCKCGRIHFLNRDDIYDTVDKNRETLFICSGCGAATRIGADDYFEGGKAMYSIDLKPGEEITKKNFEKAAKMSIGEYYPLFEKIIYSEGYRVPMMTGYYATAHIFDKWYDQLEMIDFEEQLNNFKTIEDFKVAFHEHRVKSRTVNVERLLKELPEAERKALEGYMYIFEIANKEA